MNEEQMKLLEKAVKYSVLVNGLLNIAKPSSYRKGEMSFDDSDITAILLALEPDAVAKFFEGHEVGDE